MPKRPKSKKTEQQGINYVAEVVNSANCIFNKIDTGNDVGIDAYIELVQKESTTGCCLGAQIKSGHSYFKSSGNFWKLNTDKEHLKYWHDHLLPVVAILYDTASKRAYWCDVSDYLRKNPQRLKERPYFIEIPKINTFEKSSFRSFFEHFIVYSKLRSDDDNLVQSFSVLLQSNIPFETRLSAIKSLFYFHRNEHSTWFFFVNLLRVTDDRELLHAIIFFLRHVADHGDIWWSEWNMVSHEIVKYAETLIGQSFAEKEIAKLLSFVTQDGFDRGTFGQNVAAIIARIPKPDRRTYLRNVAFNSTIEKEIRYWGLVLLAYDLQENSFNQSLEIVEKYIETFPEDLDEYPLDEYRDSLKRGTGFSIM